MDLQKYQIGDRVTIFENGSLIDGMIVAKQDGDEPVCRIMETFTNREYDAEESRILLKAAKLELTGIQMIRGAYFLATYKVKRKEYYKIVNKTEYPELNDAAQVDRDTAQRIWDKGTCISEVEKRALLAYENGEKTS